MSTTELHERICAPFSFISRIVEHNQHPASGELGTIARSSLIKALRYGGSRHAQLEQELAQDLTRIQPLCLGTPQVHIQLAIGELWLQLVGGPDC